MSANPFLMVAGLLLLGGCASDVTVPSVALNHPANPSAPEAPITPLAQTLQTSDPVIAPADSMQGMNHESMKGMGHGSMQGMDHGSMKGMDHDSMQGMDHGAHWMAPQEAAAKRNPVPADTASISRGKKLFATNCVVCHGPGGRGDGPAGAALNPKPVDLTKMAGQHSDGDFAWKIANGRGPMPAWKSVLQENQIWDLVNFIQSLGGKKPDASHGKHEHGQHQH
jgi:mono/diheme cytochrome c family protein